MQTEEKDLKIRITDIWPVSRAVFPLGGIGVNWFAENIGWGELVLYFTDDGKLYADTEHMCSESDRRFIRGVLSEIANEVIIDG